jgi:hypothetical protein
VLEEEVLEKREAALLEKEGSGCKALLTNDMSEDLSRMFRYNYAILMPLLAINAYICMIYIHISY